MRASEELSDSVVLALPDLLFQEVWMKQRDSKIALLVLSLALLATPLVIVHGAGGRIEGRVTDPKGAVLVGATVTVTDPVTNQIFTSVTDQQGRFKIEGLPAGAYSLVV